MAKKQPLTYELEERHGRGRIVCGVDEAGRGPLAGPVVAAACVLPLGCVIDGLNDSKKLSEKKREQLFDEIRERALAYGIAEASPAEIDDINILNASFLAMRRAVEQLCARFPDYAPDLLLIDGNKARGFAQETVTVVGGDAISPSIAAASILAKVTRDRMCEEMDKAYPAYEFAKHKGYPTRLHKIRVAENGPSEIHRLSFLGFLEREKEALLQEGRALREQEAVASHGTAESDDGAE